MFLQNLFKRSSTRNQYISALAGEWFWGDFPVIIITISKIYRIRSEFDYVVTWVRCRVALALHPLPHIHRISSDNRPSNLRRHFVDRFATFYRRLNRNDCFRNNHAKDWQARGNVPISDSAFELLVFGLLLDACLPPLLSSYVGWHNWGWKSQNHLTVHSRNFREQQQRKAWVVSNVRNMQRNAPNFHHRSVC